MLTGTFYLLAIGVAVGYWWGGAVTGLYAEFFHFPSYRFFMPLWVMLLAGAVTLLAALVCSSPRRWSHEVSWRSAGTRRTVARRSGSWLILHTASTGSARSTGSPRVPASMAARTSARTPRSNRIGEK